MLTPKERKEKRRDAWRNAWADTRVYVFCVVGVLFRKIVDLTEQSINLSGMSISFLGFALVIAFFTVVALETKGKVGGKRANLKRRAMQAALWGFFWQVVLSDLQEVLL